MDKHRFVEGGGWLTYGVAVYLGMTKGEVSEDLHTMILTLFHQVMTFNDNYRFPLGDLSVERLYDDNGLATGWLVEGYGSSVIINDRFTN
jgi:hypothetical protein